METPTQKNVLLEMAEQYGDIIYKENKTMARLSWLKSWDKNPRFADKKDLEKLEKQLEELGIYKPLIVYLEKDNATILGGNQRFKILKSLREKYAKKESDKYEYVWVSIVNAENDVDKLKYALSDNFSAGQYTKEKLKEVIGINQMGMFNDYQLEFFEKQEIDEFINNLSTPETELKMKKVKKDLKELGINEETIKVLDTMVNFNRVNEDLPDVEIKGCVTGQKFPMMFWFNDEEVFKQVGELFQKRKDDYDTEKLINFLENKFGVKFPTTIDKIDEIVKELYRMENEMSFMEETGENISAKEQKYHVKLEEFKAIYEKNFRNQTLI